jgi:hypothetical protein
LFNVEARFHFGDTFAKPVEIALLCREGEVVQLFVVGLVTEARLEHRAELQLLGVLLVEPRIQALRFT